MSTHRPLSATDEVTRIVGLRPPVLPEILQGGTRLTGRWIQNPFEGDTKPMREHVVSATLAGAGFLAARLDGRERVVPLLTGGVTIAPKGTEGHWRVSEQVAVSNVYLGPGRLEDCADLLAEGRAFEIHARVNDMDPRLFSILGMISAEVDSPGPHSLIFIEEALDLLCVELLRGHSTLGNVGLRPQRGLPQWQVRQITAYMRDHLSAQVLLQDLADLAGMSRFHFCGAFRAATGSAPYEYLTRMRMEAACALLAKTRLRVCDIATHVGYESATAFSTAFRKVVGLSPRGFRQRL